MESLSNINKNITIEYLKGPENLYFDRKSSLIDLKKLANSGVLAIGISDNGEIEWFNNVGIERLNEAQKIVNSYLKPVPICQNELYC